LKQRALQAKAQFLLGYHTERQIFALRPSTPGDRATFIVDHISCYPIHPCGVSISWLIMRQRSHNPHEYLLRQILGKVCTSGNAADEATNGCSELFKESLGSTATVSCPHLRWSDSVLPHRCAFALDQQ